ncbi:glycosyltransferase involved in cell wall biosynthesis [Bradyrhizobium sp. S3.9.2]
MISPSTQDDSMLRSGEERSLHLIEGRLRVAVATPLGLDGRGGIDRLNDSIFETIEQQQPHLNVEASRLVTRGQRGLIVAQFVFAIALLKFAWLVLFRRIDVLHIHLSNWGSSYRKTVVGAAARLLRVPYVVHLHGSGFDEFLAVAPTRLARAVDLLFLKSVQIVVLGEYWAHAVLMRVPQVRDKITVLPNATKLSSKPQLQAPDSRIRITCLGQLGERKGTPQLIAALQMLSQRQDWTATIAGDGSVEESRRAVAKHGLVGRVLIPGWLSSEQADDLLCKTDILALPSYAENLPMVILEAFAHGVPVISTPVGAIPEVIAPERNGFLVPAGDVSALSRAIERLIEDPELRLRLGSTAREDQAQRYEINSYVEKLTVVWRKASFIRKSM